jgi:integrase
MGVFERRRKSGTTYYVTFIWNGRQIQERAGTDKRLAQHLERQRKREVREGTYRPDRKSGSMTLATYASQWIELRKRRGVRTVDDDDGRLRLHVLPVLGSRRLDSISRSEIRSLVEQLRATGKLAPKTVRNVYGTLRTLMRDAMIDELVAIDPCVLPRGALPSARERSTSATRRQPSIFTREEVRTLVTDERVAADRRVLYALLLLTGMRHGEAAGRRWRDLDEGAQPLSALTVGTQYTDDPVKTKTPRVVPVHPALAQILREWRCSGFAAVFGRPPSSDDFIVPSPLDGCRARNTTLRNLQADCAATGVTARRTHDTRHTFISLARRDGARKEVLERVTHNAAGDIVDHYTQFDWEPLCAAVACLRFPPAE